MTEYPRAILFDLFGTLVFIDAERLPRDRVGESERIVTIPGLNELLAELTPVIDGDRFFEQLISTSRGMSKAQEKDHREIASRERFRRALRALRVDGPVAEVAAELSRRHMNSLADAVVTPPGRPELVRALRARSPVALISNFDDGPTAWRILEAAGLADAFDAVRISEEVGVRKPASELFSSVAEELGVPAAACLHVGDSRRADVGGATGAGMAALWVSEEKLDVAPALDSLGDVDELPGWLDRRFGVQPA